MYLRKKIASNFTKKSFTNNSFKKYFGSFTDALNRNSLAYRMTKYDPTKELEVIYII
jgi:hypothetical protein